MASPAGIAIRPARPADYEAACGLFAEADALHGDALPQVFRAVEGPARSREFFEAALSSDDAAIRVAEAGGRLVGLVHVVIGESRDLPMMVPRRFAVIDSLVVAAAWRRRGIGCALLEAAHQWAAARGVRDVQLTVWDFNAPAIALYEKLGYTMASRRMWRSLEAE